MYLLWEFYNVAIAELISTTVSSVVAVSIVALVFVPHWSALFYIVPMVSIVYIDLLGKSLYQLHRTPQGLEPATHNTFLLAVSGTMQVAGLHINAVTYVCLVISIGLIVDFLMHILLRYEDSGFIVVLRLYPKS